MVEEQQVSVGHLKVSVRVFRSSNPLLHKTVVCLHGFPDTNHSFDALGEHLAHRGFTVLCPMLRGYETS